MHREANAEAGRFDRILLTCEHASSVIPRRYAPLFAGARHVLRTHRGLDVGALGVARRLSAALGVELHVGRTSRLLVELNRSLHHRHLFSRYVAPLDRAAKEEILRRHYHPYRDAAASWIERQRRAGLRVLHLSVHSFTPVLCGEVRQVDIGLMYDPGRPLERELCARWRATLRDADARLRVRRNHPYRGVADGFQPHLRRRFSGPGYTAVEVEVNQKHLRPGASSRGRVIDALRASLLRVLDGDHSK